jgi:hypothetical protein
LHGLCVRCLTFRFVNAGGFDTNTTGLVAAWRLLYQASGEFGPKLAGPYFYDLVDLGRQVGFACSHCS